MAGDCVITSTPPASNVPSDSAPVSVSVSVSQGHVYFVPAGTTLAVKALPAGVVYYKAHVNMQNL